MQTESGRKNARPNLVALGMIALATLTTACGGGGSNPNVAGISYSTALTSSHFLFNVILKTVQIDLGGRFEISAKLPNSYIEIGPDFASNGTLVTTALAIVDVSSQIGANPADPHALPGGRPLPGVAEGALPGYAVTLSKLKNITVYFGNKAFGIFMPVALPVKEAIATFRFYSSGKRVGNISVVGKDSAGANSGILVLMTQDMVNSAAGKKLL